MTAVEDAKDPIETALLSLLRHHSDALVAAVSGDSTARLVPLPDHILPGYTRPRISGELAITAVAEADRAVVARVWSRARVMGHARATVHLEEPPVTGTVHMLDLRHLYDLMVVVFTEGDEQEVPELTRLAVEERPTRLGRMIKDGSAAIVDVDPAVESLLGWTREELVGTRSLELIHPDDQEMAINGWVQMLDLPGSSRSIRLRHRHRDGYWVWVEVHNHNRLADPDHGDVVAEMVDISDEVAAQEAVLARQQLLEQLTETLPIGLFHADLGGHLLYANRRLTEITGLPVGSRLADWPGVSNPRFLTVIHEALRSAASGHPTDSVVDMVQPGGDTRHCSLSLRPLADRSGSVTGVTGAVEDVTTSVVERRQLEVRAATDDLTGCLNRPATMALVQDALDRLHPGDRPGGVALIFLDVDGLKDINDRLGHPAGDALLIEVAGRLTSAVRSRDTVGRYGGDEFVVLAQHVRSAEHALTVARWVAARTLRRVVIEGEPIDIRVSLGVAWTAAAGVSAEALIRRADAAMYRSKHDGRCEPVLAPAR